MIKIRNSVFETNSSSMHSLVIKKNGTMITADKAKEDFYAHDGVLEIWNDDAVYFDRYPFEILTKPLRKFEYLVASFAKNEKVRNEIIELYKAELGLKDIIFPSVYSDEYEPNYGCVDHQSIGLVTKYLEKNKISFKDFIFNDKYVIIIDGDEYGAWENAKESGIINLEEIEVEINPWNSETDDDEYDE